MSVRLPSLSQRIGNILKTYPDVLQDFRRMIRYVYHEHGEFATLRYRLDFLIQSVKLRHSSKLYTDPDYHDAIAAIPNANESVSNNKNTYL